MSNNPFDDLPDQIREALKEMMKRLQKIDPEELEMMMNQVFGDDFLDKLKDLNISGSSFNFPLDPSVAKNFEVIMKDLMGTNPTGFAQNFDEVEEEEPYYEITPPINGEGQIIIDMPGISDLRQIKWEKREKEVEVIADSEEAKYKLKIPFSPNYKLKNPFASVKNSVFILPFSSE